MIKYFNRLIWATSFGIIIKSSILLTKNIFFLFLRYWAFFRALIPERFIYLFCEFLNFSVLISMRKQYCLFTKAWPLVDNMWFSFFVNYKQFFLGFWFLSWCKISFKIFIVWIKCFMLFLDNNICGASSRFIAA
jgi:hypothetical protein